MISELIVGDNLCTMVPYNSQLDMMGGVPRHPDWDKVRNDYVLKNPKCICCGTNRKLNVHHKLPYHIFPQFELLPSNLATLCEGGGSTFNCHLWVGHCGNWRAYNNNVVLNAAYIGRMLMRRQGLSWPKTILIGSLITEL